ncbi:acyl-CoA dehydrogenase [Herbiconiux sp. CPCC 205763]|uniref:Acyl-CoA dehydrogenase n=1 Tax=Herbiconiux aconitum TaxID=2970913 RepID=A0ABT2GSJ8_9MICO|nr:acyl-CoA dehydrogenase [Herbiconiux aconitum]MCS5719153.1 acyl-CoA dehydrogenase [Herbiconiux aconitum]
MSDGVTLDDVSLGEATEPQLCALFAEARSVSGDLAAALALARRVGRDTPRPGGGRTARYFETLATLAAADVTVARVIEPHLDALAILAECPAPVDLAAVGADADSTWGVFAAEGPGVRLDAIPDAGGWLLDGTKPWCSLAGVLSHALVTAHVGGERRLFAVALQQPGVSPHPEAWVARGFPDVPSGPTEFARVLAVPVGEPGWYLARAGFEWGGVGVAACWFGGAVGVGRRVVDAVAKRNDDVSALHAGRVATSLTSARAVLAAAARAIDGEGARGAVAADGVVEADTGAPGAGHPMGATDRALLAQMSRSAVRKACDEVLHEAAQALGPAPQALDAAYAARVADLSLYLLQHHGDRDSARIGRLIVEGRR